MPIEPELEALAEIIGADRRLFVHGEDVRPDLGVRELAHGLREDPLVLGEERQGESRSGGGSLGDGHAFLRAARASCKR